MNKKFIRKIAAAFMTVATVTVSVLMGSASVVNAQVMPGILLPNGDIWTKYGVNITEPDIPIVSPFSIAFLGDSITRGDGAGFSYADVVCQDMGAVKLSYYKGEDTIAELDDFGMIDRYKKINPAANVIVVFGGSYDYYFNVRLGSEKNWLWTEYGGCVARMCEGLRKNYPNSYIVFMTPMQGALNDFENCRNNDNGDTMEDYVDVMKKACALYNVPVIDLYHNSGITYKNYDQYTTDGFHLNEKGHRIVAGMLEEFLQQYMWKK